MSKGHTSLIRKSEGKRPLTRYTYKQRG